MLCSLAVMSTLLYAQRLQEAQRPRVGNWNRTQPRWTAHRQCQCMYCDDREKQYGLDVQWRLPIRPEHFEIQHLAMGTFLVSAVKEEDGYAAFNQAAGDHNKVVLTLQEPTANVTIKLGPKAGMLIGSVRDSVTGKRVDKIRVLYTAATDERVGGGTASGYMGGNFSLNLPTATDFVIIVTAPGYKPWIYNDPVEGLSLHLAPGEQKSVDIEMVPDPKATTKDAAGRGK